MPDQPSTSLTDQALARLRRLADGNGLKPDAIALVAADEKTYTLKGVMDLVPFCEVGGGRYAGPPRGKNKTILPDHNALQMEGKKRQHDFLNGKSWIAFAIAKLKEQPGEGWGLDGVRIDLPQQSATLAASGPCPQCRGQRQVVCRQCQGQRNILCPHCQGRKLEICYICNGRGENPLQNGEPCPTCNGTRYAPCRQCAARGTMPCPTCHGQGGTPCPMCKASGLVSEDIVLTCGVTTNFRIAGEGMPSGFRRGLDRLGIANLAKGHADIASVDAPDETPHDAPPRTDAPPEPGSEKEQAPVLHYQAQVPYADLRLSFNGKRALVGAFGKRAALLDVPPFLDAALQPWRDRLTQATRGETTLQSLTDARAMRDALALTIAGKEKPEDLRRIYSVGLSNDAAKEILLNMRRALDRFTLRMRGVVAFIYALLCAGLFGGLFLTPTHAQITRGWTPQIITTADLALPVIIILSGWLMLSASTRVLLRQKFPAFKIPLLQKTGKIGLGMTGCIAVVYMVCLFIAPQKPVWVLNLLQRLHLGTGMN